MGSFEQLARCRHQPDLKNFRITVHANEGSDPANVEVGLHSFLFNVSDHTCILRWGHGDDEKILAPGDSAYVAPSVPHSFTNAVTGDEAQIFTVRIPGKTTTGVLNEFAMFQAEGRS